MAREVRFSERYVEKETWTSCLVFWQVDTKVRSFNFCRKFLMLSLNHLRDNSSAGIAHAKGLCPVQTLTRSKTKCRLVLFDYVHIYKGSVFTANVRTVMNQSLQYVEHQDAAFNSIISENFEFNSVLEGELLVSFYFYCSLYKNHQQQKFIGNATPPIHS